MKLFQKRVKTFVGLLLVHSLLPGSAFSSEKEKGFFDTLFGDDAPTPKRAHHKTATPTRGALSLAPPSQTPVIDQKPQPLHLAVAFLQSIPEVLEKMEAIERSIPSLVSEHPKNPMNIFNHQLFDAKAFDPQLPPDWRVSLMYNEDTDLKALEKLVVQPIKKISAEDLKNIEMAKQKRLKLVAEKAARDKAEEEHPVLVSGESLEQEKKQKAFEEQVSLLQNQIQGLLPTWFFYMCNPESMHLKQFERDSLFLHRWWRSLPFEVLNSPYLQPLFNSLQHGNDTPRVIMLLNNFLVESLLLRSQKAYHQLLPKYLDLETSFLTLKTTLIESIREDKALPQILGNKELFKKIEVLIANSMREKVIGLVNEALKQKPEDEFVAKEIRTAVNEVIDIILSVRADVDRSRPPEVLPEIESSDVEVVLKKKLRQKFLNGLKSTLYNSLQEAGEGNKEDDSDRSRSSTKESENTGSETEIKKTITVDIEKIMDVLYERMGVLKPKPTSTGGWYTGGWWGSSLKNPAYIITVTVPDAYIKQWTIPASAKPTPPKRPPVRVWTKKRQVSPLADHEMITRRTALFRQIEGVREPSIRARNPQELGLVDFLNENRFSLESYKSKQKKPKRDDFLFDLPRTLAFVPGMDASQLVGKLELFFQEFSAIIDSYSKKLHKEGPGPLKAYLDPARPSRDFYRGRKIKLRDSFPLLEDPKAVSGWFSLEYFGPFAEKLTTEKEIVNFRAELQGHIHMFNLLEVFASDNLVGQTPFNVSNAVLHAKKVLLFKEKCWAISGKSKFPEQNEHAKLQDFLLESKARQFPGGLDALRDMLRRPKDKPKDQQYWDDRALLIKFFIEVFKVTLTECISEFCPPTDQTPEMLDNKLEEFKRLYPSPSKEGGEPNPLLSSSSTLLLGASSQEDLLSSSLYIPVEIGQDAGVANDTKKGDEATLS